MIQKLEMPPVMRLPTVRSGAGYYFFKRCFDLLVAAILVVVLTPALAVIALAIKLDSPGPVLFVHPRVGARRRFSDDEPVWETRVFEMYKFRSMYHKADPSIHEAHIKAFVANQPEAETSEGAKFKLSHDPRITRVGRLLRRTSMDELPQLFNVLKADMSLVGPRPVPTYEVALYEPWQRERLAAVPGMTGLWQVKGRCDLPFDEMVRLDLEYVRHPSLWTDLKILVWTIPAVLSGRGAD
jgi:lipopolysaccharide/colanic/teichoic acid biosynthesis glycosyltransferase